MTEVAEIIEFPSLSSRVEDESSSKPDTNADSPTSSSNDSESNAKPEKSQSNNSKDNNHLAIGLGVGLGVGGAMLLAAIILVLFWRKKRNAPALGTQGQTNVLGPTVEQKPLSYSREAELPVDYRSDAELPGREIASAQNRFELENRERHHEMP